jgi:plasmid maintenance system killer protein
MNFYPPQSEDYHLVLDAANKIYECRKNDNLCMTMKFDGTCTACYED